MEELEIYFSDLKPETRKALLKLYGVNDEKDMNWDTFPLFTMYPPEEGDEDIDFEEVE